MKKIMIILGITFIAFTFSQSFANGLDAELYSYDLNDYVSKSDTSSSSIRFSWLIERYNFNQYIQDRYGIYYQYYREYLDTQQEIAGKFGLTSIYLRPDFRQYDNSRLVLIRNLWNDRLSFRYLAPLHDMSDCEFMLAFRPNQSFSIVVRSKTDGEGSVAIAITRPFGEKKKENNTIRYTKNIIRKVTGTKM